MERKREAALNYVGCDKFVSGNYDPATLLGEALPWIWKTVGNNASHNEYKMHETEINPNHITE